MANVTTNIEHWYEMNEPEDQQDRDDLIQSVETVAPAGCYTTEEEHGQLLVTGWGSDRLRLVSDKAKVRFLRYVRQSKMVDDSELEFRDAVKGAKS